ncbi:Dyp-type peroxidase [Paracoccus aurantiacus]|uniref:Dyp-type peroxidase n=1 Tax=Paracoccus aurantiacus TaxID=2599412 RepID=A0A5C6S8S3_9RHOB|nr:Dyp-type peroxidase [Paracoccus aurantiacus]TXB70810.1 Dyp-type peroxidase [Paracoccus aurantiacus]
MPPVNLPGNALPPESQPVEKPLTRAAIFIVVNVKPDDRSLAQFREFCGNLASLIRAVGFRNPDARLTCIAGIGSALWDRLDQPERPAGLHPMRAISGVYDAPSTPGDLLLHIRAERPDFCFEFATEAMRALGDSVVLEDETQGFKFFDNRDLLGFVDGTENPEGQALGNSVLIGAEDPAFIGGSYVITQKYMHDMAKWNAIPVEQQERIIGRHKLSDIEYPDDQKAPYAHNVLTSIDDAEGQQLQILRDNMPFGSPARSEFGTYFIGYARDPARIERMLDNMFIGDPPGNYDRILDVSTPVTGSLFFVPSATLLESLADAATPADAGKTEGGGDPQTDAGGASGSLHIGSLKQENQDE